MQQASSFFTLLYIIELFQFLILKVVRAKERIEFELDQKIIPDQITEAKDDSSNRDSTSNSQSI